MPADLRQALCVGYERMVPWASLLDRINVFPVPDGDTGRNLAISLAPLRNAELPAERLEQALLWSARGNSGNIAVAFVLALLHEDGGPDWIARIPPASDSARAAVATPKPGTMLSVFDALRDALSARSDGDVKVDGLVNILERAVENTTCQLDCLRNAGVVDSGALGMLLFFNGMLREYFGQPSDQPPIDRLVALSNYDRASGILAPDAGYCVDAVVRVGSASEPTAEQLALLGHEVIALGQGEYLKVHFHAQSAGEARQALGKMGQVVRWASDDLAAQTTNVTSQVHHQPVHVVTDAAGSVTRQDAEQLGMTLLDSYVNIGNLSIPETRLAPEELYSQMAQGTPVSTSQASVFERHQHFDRIAKLYPKALYLCVGSAFTGNYSVATDWIEQHDQGSRITVLDTGAASGRLAVIALATARLAALGTPASEVAAFATRAIEDAEEYIFLEKLTYLARGGRMSKTGAWLAGSVGVTPVVSPLPSGAKPVSFVRTSSEKTKFALKKAAKALSRSGGKGLVLLQYSDNIDHVQSVVACQIRHQFANAEVVVQPLSLTSGAHMGPGTWALAVLPALNS